MKSDNKILLMGTFVLLLIFLASCKEEKESEYPLNGPIPQSDIVFMPDVDPVHCKFKTKTLGFINADGSNRQEYTFTLIAGAVSMFGKEITSQCAWAPRWSQDGDELVFGIGGQPPEIRLIDKNGKMFGRTCEDIGAGGVFAFDLYGNILIGIGEEDLLYEEYKNIANPGLIARYDLKKCEDVSVFSVPVEYLVGFGIQESNNGLLTVAFWDSDEDIDKILIYNQTTGETKTMPGFHPSLTEDGTLLAYYNRDGALVIRDMETGKERELISVIPAPQESYESYVSMPSWSPDHQWLVYNTPEGEIFKINIETGENVYLTYGWAPDWR